MDEIIGSERYKEYHKIRYELALKHVSLTDIAKEFGCSQQMVRLSLLKERTSDTAQEIVARAEEIINE